MTRVALIVLVVACGSKSKPESKPEHADEHHEMANMPPEMAKFHDVLAPHWHAPKGTQRMTSTCTAIPEFQSNADALAKAAPPAGSEATWAAATKELVDAVAGLKAACDAVDPNGFETAFERVHKGFHGLMEGGEHHM